MEDHGDTAFLLTQLIASTIADANIAVAHTSETAIPQIAWADLIISDFNFPTQGFPSLLPIIQAARIKFILQTADYTCLRCYDPTLQLASVHKGIDFVPKMRSVLQSI